MSPPTFLQAFPYQKDKMNLPVADIEASIPFYINTMGFLLVSRNNQPIKSAIIERDSVQLGIAENGGDPTQDGAFIEVSNVKNAKEELISKGLKIGELQDQKHGTTSWKVFFVVAPDGLCYCLGEKV